MQGSDILVVSSADFEGCASYFRVLYQVMKFNFINNNQSSARDFVDFLNGEPMASDEIVYAEFLKAHLNGRILQWIALYGVADDKLSPFVSFSWLLRRYNFLEHMRPDNPGDIKLCEQLRSYHGYSPQS
jgi:hypothetical protein